MQPEPDLEPDDLHVQAMYDVTVLMNKLLTKHGITFWMTAGTLIGALRNRPPGPMSWDDDIDFGAFLEERQKIATMFTDPEFSDVAEYTVTGFGYAVGSKQHKAVAARHFCLDLFLYHETEKKYGKGWYAIGGRNASYDKEYFTCIEEILPVVFCNFWDFTLPRPRNCTILYRGFGYDVLRTGVRWNHGNLSTRKKVRLWENVNNKNLVPALTKDLLSRLVFAESKDSTEAPANSKRMPTQ